MSLTDPALSKPSPDRSHWKRIYWILAMCTLVSAGIYLLVSALFFRVGFPLDDAWIHQTYARNLAQEGEWAFIPGKASGGSTAPLWSALLAVGFWIRLAPYAWAYFLGAVALWGIAVLSEKSVRQMVPSYISRFPWVGVVLLLEWHLVWGALSGMETLLFTLLATLVLTLLISGSKRFFSLGLLAGLSVWIRPDGITLLGPLAMVLLLTLPNWSSRLRAMVGLVLGFGSIFAFYLLFNLMVAGSPWPNTFYAKQAEYAVYLQIPLWKRVGMEVLQPLIGVGIALLPGMVMLVISAVRRREVGHPGCGDLVARFLDPVCNTPARHLPARTLSHPRHADPLPARPGRDGGVPLADPFTGRHTCRNILEGIRRVDPAHFLGARGLRLCP